jgi:hypothetical protein
MGCSSSAYTVPQEPLPDDKYYGWLDDLDTFMGQVFNQDMKAWGVNSDTTIEMAGRGLLDPPFENADEEEYWYRFRDAIFQAHSNRDTVDTAKNSGAKPEVSGAKQFFQEAEEKEDIKQIDPEIVKSVASKYLWKSAYLQMRAKQYIDRISRGEDSLVCKASFHGSFSNKAIDMDDEDEDVGSVEDDYTDADVVSGGGDLGI